MYPQSPRFFGRRKYYPSNSSLIYDGNYGQPKKKLSSKKLLIIVLIAAVFLISIFAIIGSMRKDEVPHASEETISALNRYANWILYGEESDEDFSKEEYNERHLYKAEEVLSVSSESVAYFEKASELMSGLYELYLEDDGATDTVFGVVSGSKALIEFLIEYSKTGEIDDHEQLYDIYDENGYEGALSYIDSFYEPYYEIGIAVAEGFVEEKKTNEKNLLEIYHIYDQNSCRNEGPACQISEEERERIQSLREENSDLYINQHLTYMYTYVRTLQTACYDLKGSLDS